MTHWTLEVDRFLMKVLQFSFSTLGVAILHSMISPTVN